MFREKKDHFGLIWSEIFIENLKKSKILIEEENQPHSKRME